MTSNLNTIASLLHGAEMSDKDLMKRVSGMAKDLGVVIAHGYSDDLCIFSGAWDDDYCVYGEDGEFTDIPITKNGILKNKCDDDKCPYFEKEKCAAAKISISPNFAITSSGPRWNLTSETIHSLMHAVINEDGMPFTEVLIFYAKDVK